REAEGEVFNLGGAETSLRELATQLIELTGRGTILSAPFPPERQSIDIGDCYSSFQKIKASLGWQPRISLTEGLSRTLDYYQKYYDEYCTPMSIPFLDLSRQHKELASVLNASLERTLARGVYILGPEVEAFETEWAKFSSASSAAGVASGTDALALALIASGAVRPEHDDEVITSPLTAGYSVLAIKNAGGVPVFADIDPQTLTLDPDPVRQAITPRTRAIMPVHLYGQLADMPAIKQIAKRHGLTVIEDAAQAHGATREFESGDSVPHAAAFSFYPT